MKEQRRVTKTQVRIAYAILTALGMFYAWHAFQLPMGRPFGSGSGATPALIGLIWCLVGGYLTIRPSPLPSEDSDAWPSKDGFRRIGTILAFCVAYVAVMSFLGVVVTSFIFMFAMALALGGSPLRSLMTSALLTAGL